MSTSIPLFEYPEFNETFNELYDKLLEESGRGAILIGTSYIEEHLEKFILKILPSNNKKYTSRLLNYPGPLSSFSAKLELCYAFRLISERTYDSLNTLRKIRNDAAHSSSEFDLANIELHKIFNLGEGFMTVVHESSTKMMLNLKFESLKLILEKEGMSEQEINDYLLKKFQEEENIKILESQLPHWKLVFGISMICGLLRFYSDETELKLNGIEIWSQLKNKKDD